MKGEGSGGRGAGKRAEELEWKKLEALTYRPTSAKRSRTLDAEHPRVFPHRDVGARADVS